MQPVDLYLGFEVSFFDKEERNEVSERYRSFLEKHKDAINTVLINKEQPENLEKDFYQALDDLSVYEELYSYSINKDVDRFETVNLLCEAAGFPDHSDKMCIYGYIELHLNRLVFPRRYIKKSSLTIDIFDLEIQHSACEEY